MNSNILDELVRGERNLGEAEALDLIDELSGLYKKLDNVVEIPDSGIVFVGDLHGELEQAQKVARRYIRRYHVVFLGDYGDRGPKQVETVNLVVAMAVTHPDRVTMLRGNHETKSVAEWYGLFGAVSEAYSREVFEEYCRAFETLPLAAINSRGVFCCHGGVPEGVTSLADLMGVNRFQVDPTDPIVLQILWNDPREGDFAFMQNLRGGESRYFGRMAFEEFRRNLGIDLIVRAHEVHPNGYIWLFDNHLLSVFSATYLGRVSPKVAVIDKKGQIKLDNL